MPGRTAILPRDPKYIDILERYSIPKAYHDEFAKFVKTGEASQQFTRFLDEDDDCQQALEAAFLRLMERIGNVLAVLRGK